MNTPGHGPQSQASRYGCHCDECEGGERTYRQYLTAPNCLAPASTRRGQYRDHTVTVLGRVEFEPNLRRVRMVDGTVRRVAADQLI